MPTDEHSESVSGEELQRALEEMPNWEVDEPTLDETPQEELPVPEEEPTPVEPEPEAEEVAEDNQQPPPMIRILEAMLFVGDAPLTEARACGTIKGLTSVDFHQAIRTLGRWYRSQGRPYYVRLEGNGYTLALRSRFNFIKERMFGSVRETRLSPLAIEVLSLVAYRQPTTRIDIDNVRGANSIGLLRQLVRHGLIAVQRDAASKEPSYITTSRFLELFELKSLDDLPQTQELRHL